MKSLAAPPASLPAPTPPVAAPVPVDIPVEIPEPVIGSPHQQGDPITGSSGEAPQGWVEPVDGGCPDGYPIKAKVASGIFHQPGGLSYERTKPDRCYADAASAESDGFRAAKR